MHKIEVTLKQHTPLIHFQHDQEGATLRATEVKPKLDRFILTKLGEDTAYQSKRDEIAKGMEEKFNKQNSYEKGKLIAKDLGWLIGKGEQPALDYKMKIMHPNNTPKKYIIASRLPKNQADLLKNKDYEVINFSPYFAQEKEFSQLFQKDNMSYRFTADYESKLAALSKIGIKYDTITSELISFNKPLLEYIIGILQEFFVVENFGTRNGKGFGSFTVSSMKLDGDTLRFREEVESWLKNNYDFVYKKACNGKDPFQIIQNDYKLMKAGYGRFEKQEGYQKSLLFLYFAQKNIRWEKRWFKQKIKELTLTKPHFTGYTLKQERGNGDPIDINLKQSWDDTQCPNNSNENYYYIRALLGLAEVFDFSTNNKNVKISVKVNCNNELERFKSPIIFKIINNNIYLVGNDNIPTQLHDYSPTFSIFKKENNEIVKESEIGIDPSIKIPNNFSLKDFISFCIKNSNGQYRSLTGYTPLKK
ncbi:MAG: hypothetical protein ACOYU1_08310 [Bacteroidota bacterium]|jgi:hypothetical protein